MNTTTATPRKRWSKKKKALVLGGVPLGMIATTAAAAAIFAALAGIQGTGTNGDFTAKWSLGQATTVMDTSALTVKPQGDATISGGTLQLPANLVMYPGESFTIEAAVTSGGASQAGYVSGVAMPGLPAGYTASVVSGCGAKITNSLQYVKVEVKAPAAQTAGAQWSLAGDSGVRVTPLASTSSPAPSGVTCAAYVAP